MRALKLFGTSAVAALIATSAQADYTLNILHINDLHSRIESINRFDSTCSAEDEGEGKCFGGIARIVTKVNELRDEITGAGGNVAVLSAGDAYQGSLYYTTYKGKAEAEFMEKLGLDASAVGNHEFDDGPDGLDIFLENVSFPVLAGNVDTSASNILAGKVPGATVLEIGGEKIGIISALTTDTAVIAAPGDTIGFSDEITSLQAQADVMTADGINKIIALTHVGFGKDLEIAEKVRGVDVVVGGHTNTYLSASDPKRDGAYPTWVSGADGALVPVVHAYAFGKYLGHLEIEFDDAGTVTFASGDALVLDASVTPDADTLARVTELGGPIEELKALVVANTANMIDGSRENCRAMECQMGNLVADAMLDRVKGQGVSIAIQNGGGLRASIDSGEVTMGEVLTVLPFQNTLATFEVSGADVLAALENGVSQIEDGAGRFPQVAGLKFTFDKNAAPGARISDVMVAEGDGFAPLDPAKIYGLASNNYVRNGGDGYEMFKSAANAYDYGPGMEDVLAEYLAKNAPYEPFTDGRISAK